MEYITDNFKYKTEQFADIEILRYRIPGFDKLTLKEKELVYYLYEAALSGREIIYDQNYKFNLKIKRTLEAILQSYKGDKDNCEYENFLVYLKRLWFSNGIHHHYSTKKFLPGFTKDYFEILIKNSDRKLLPLKDGGTAEQLFNSLAPIMFDENIAAQRINLDTKSDVIKTSATNFYEGATQKEVEDFYKEKTIVSGPAPASYGLNSKLVKEKGELTEKIWKVGGMYSSAIEKIVFWLGKAVKVAENENQKAAINKLIEYYKTGCLKTFDEYSILWLKDNNSRVDTINGFIELYGDPLGYKGTFEAIVSIRDLEATKRIKEISSQAQWFEDNSPIDDKYKKKNVTGISATAISVIVESGDASPSSPIGINLPNATWIREKYGSKSVNLENIDYAYKIAETEDLLREFAYSNDEINLANKYAHLADTLHTDLHEVIGHGSGRILQGIESPKHTLKNYASTIEETRADLVALYYLPDQKLIDIGIMPDLNTAKAGYNKFMRNGLMVQLARIEISENLEESHMRNRQLIAKWVYEKGKIENVIEMKKKNGKTYVVINDYSKLRKLFGELLKEIQRITSEGDFESAKNLVDTYGVKIDIDLHKEVKERYDKLSIPPYKGFINPVLKPIFDKEKIIDVQIEYPEDFTEQMLYYAEKYSYLPTSN